MANTLDGTPVRAHSTRAKTWRALASLVLEYALKASRFCRDPRQSLPRLTDRQSRDAGLDPADLEWSQLKLPSKTMRHPML